MFVTLVVAMFGALAVLAVITSILAMVVIGASQPSARKVSVQTAAPADAPYEYVVEKHAIGQRSSSHGAGFRVGGSVPFGGPGVRVGGSMGSRDVVYTLRLRSFWCDERDVIVSKEGFNAAEIGKRWTEEVASD